MLTFNGPGQGMALRQYGLGMRPDWERVINHVVDWLCTFAQSETGRTHTLDLDRIGVLGASVSGYFALRVAAHPEIQACVSIDPPYDMWELATKKLPNFFINGWLSGRISDSFVNALISFVSRFNTQLR